MDVTIQGAGPAAVQEISDLQEWISQARLREVTRVEQQKRPPAGGEQGPELIELLQVVLAGPALVALVGCIKEYIVARTPSMKIIIKTKTHSITIDAKNPPSPEELEKLAKSLQSE